MTLNTRDSTTLNCFSYPFKLLFDIYSEHADQRIFKKSTDMQTVRWISSNHLNTAFTRTTWFWVIFSIQQTSFVVLMSVMCISFRLKGIPLRSSTHAKIKLLLLVSTEKYNQRQTFIFSKFFFLVRKLVISLTEEDKHSHCTPLKGNYENSCRFDEFCRSLTFNFSKLDGCKTKTFPFVSKT